MSVTVNWEIGDGPFVSVPLFHGGDRGRSFCFCPPVSCMSKGTETKGPSPFPSVPISPPLDICGLGKTEDCALVAKMI